MATEIPAENVEGRWAALTAHRAPMHEMIAYTLLVSASDPNVPSAEQTGFYMVAMAIHARWPAARLVDEWGPGCETALAIAETIKAHSVGGRVYVA